MHLKQLKRGMETKYWPNWFRKIRLRTLCLIFQRCSTQKLQRFPFSSECSNSVNILARKLEIFKNGSEFGQKLIGNDISEICWQKCVKCWQVKWSLRGGASKDNRGYVLASPLWGGGNISYIFAFETRKNK